ncbi:prokineticin-2-like isoform X2 [Daphnia pulex]|uniref:prokineticin-2-like isoform X2 n=1 Tax=Daphnia pulex TaxID=6669 RepID=UPI001EDE3B3D|nr:prokineticin-2-like isoform X2 [Daphnia pulex]
MFFKLQNLYYCAALLLIQLTLVTQQLVPYSGATRFVPNWWTAVHQAAGGECRNSEDCSADECCVRSTGSRLHRFCLPLRQTGEACRLTQNLVDPSHEQHHVYLNLCPCTNGLVCREIHGGWVDAECVASRNPADLLRHSFLQAILNAMKQRRQQSNSRRNRIPVNSFSN